MLAIGSVGDLADYGRVRYTDDNQWHKVHCNETEPVVGRLQRLVVGKGLESHALPKARKLGMNLHLEEYTLRQCVESSDNPSTEKHRLSTSPSIRDT